MKNIDQIEKLSLEQLEEIAENKSLPGAPDTLLDGIKAGLTAKGLAEYYQRKLRKRRIETFAIGAFALASVLALVFVLRTPQPRDTFSDPALALAQIEKTFQLISDKTDRGRELAYNVAEIVEKPRQIIRKANHTDNK